MIVAMGCAIALVGALILVLWRRHATPAKQQPPRSAVGLDTVAHRLASAHPVSGLPMREALLARMTADRAGTLGAIAFADFDRLTAFDPALEIGRAHV